MQAYGSDRVRPGEGDQQILFSRLPKNGWTPRVEKTLTSAEFPGTAVLWEEQFYEVVSADPLPQGGVRYVLEPWREHHAMRLTDRYDADSEAHRVEENRKNVRREKARISANVLGVLTGHLPAVVQEELGRELGILPPRLTFISIVGEIVVIGALVLYCVSRVMAQDQIPTIPGFAVIYLGVETLVRAFVNWTQSRPIGSSIGFFSYLIFHLITGRGLSPFAVEKGFAVKITEAPPEIAMRDAYAMREGFVTLLTPADQARVAARFGYDYRRDSYKFATMILVVALIGVVSSYLTRGWISMIVAAALAAEQIVRLAAFRRGPAASVLRFFVRPLVRKLL